jgi:hypothetical protein
MRQAGAFLAIVAMALIEGTAHAEPFIDLGVASHKLESKIANRDDWIKETDSGVHIGIGARRKVADRSDLAVRVEIDSIASNTFLAVRAFDYRYHVSERLALTAFLGAARLSLATPAYGYYLGGGVQWKEIVSNWDLSLDFRIGDKVARDNLLPSDPQGGSPDNFHDVTGLSLYMSYRF